MNRILILDDEDFICKLISKIASKKGYLVDISHNYPDALSYLSKINDYSFFFIDYNVDRSSIQNISKIIRDNSNKTKIVLMSGIEESEIDMKNHYDIYIFKPELVEQVNKIL